MRQSLIQKVNVKAFKGLDNIRTVGILKSPMEGKESRSKNRIFFHNFDVVQFSIIIIQAIKGMGWKHRLLMLYSPVMLHFGTLYNLTSILQIYLRGLHLHILNNNGNSYLRLSTFFKVLLGWIKQRTNTEVLVVLL